MTAVKYLFKEVRKLKKIKKITILQIFVISMMAVVLLLVSLKNNQATMSFPLPAQFLGEYRQGDGEWENFSEETTLSALDGDVTLRGHFQYEIPEGVEIHLYVNHIGYRLSVNGGVIDENAAMTQELIPDYCGRGWMEFVSPGITTEDEVEITLHNPHTYGNSHAYNEFLGMIFAGSDTVIEHYLDPYCYPFQAFGALLIIISILLAGGAIASVFLRSKGASLLQKGSAVSFCAGLYVYLDTADCFFEQGILALFTYAQVLTMMLFPFFLSLLAMEFMRKKERKIAERAVAISGVFDLTLMILSVSGIAVIYDLIKYWAIAQVVFCVPFSILCIRSMKEKGKRKKTTLAFFAILFLTLLCDLAGLGENVYSRAVCTKTIFMVMAVFYLVILIRDVIVNQKAAARMEKLDKELEESRIAVMLTQIQPHFLYNCLNTIYYLCGKDGATAQQAVSDFSDYLQINLKSLNQKYPVPFLKELKHVKTYLKLEQLRFEDDLHIVYKIGPDHFSIPALSLQPLVENAVKHGICPKEGRGTVTIETWETKEDFVVSVTDDGVGFEVQSFTEDEKKHIGINNVRRRLWAMSNALLEIDSTPGKGTTARIRIPKEETK